MKKRRIRSLVFGPEAPRNDLLKEQGYDALIVAEYAGLKKGTRNIVDVLPDATQLGIRLARQLYDEGCVPLIAWGNSEFPGPGTAELHRAKFILLNKGRNEPITPLPVVSNNTIQEVQRLADAIPLRCRRILVVCDKAQAKRYRKLMLFFFPDVDQIDVRWFKARWNEGHPSPFQRSAFRWYAMNWIYYLILSVLGTKKFVELMAKKTHVGKSAS